MGWFWGLLVLITLALVALGLGTVYSASATAAQMAGQSSAAFFLKQLGGVMVGLVIFAIFAKVDAELFYRWAWPLMILSILLLLLIILPYTQSIAPRIRGSPGARRSRTSRAARCATGSAADSRTRSSSRSRPRRG